MYLFFNVCYIPFIPLSSKSSAEEMEEMSFFHFLPPSGRKSFLPEETQPCPQQRRNRHQPSPAPQSPLDVSTPMHTNTIDETGEDPEDVLRLARIQGRVPPARTPSGESIMSETSYASVVRREQLSQQRRSVAEPANRVNRGNRYNPNCIMNREQLIRTNPEQDQK